MKRQLEPGRVGLSGAARRAVGLRRAGSRGRCTSPARGAGFIRLASMLVVVALIAAVAATPVGATEKCGSICDEVWDLAGSPYVVTDDCGTATLTVGAGCTLTIDAGVEVRFEVATPLIGPRVAGTLDANGTVDSLITFTSASAAPQPGDWRGLQVDAGGTATMDYARVSYGNNGVYVQGGATLQATGCAFTQNLLYGVRAVDNSVVSARDSEIHSNQGSWDFVAHGWSDPNTILDATGNWWGTTDPVQIAQRIYDSLHDIGAAIVDRCNYRSSAGGPPVLDAHCPDLYICDESDMWDQTDKPYHLTTRFRVCPTGTLTVGPGVDVLTGPDQNGTGREIRVEGTLEVQGTAAAPVTFGSSNASPQPGDWSGLYIRGGTGVLNHARVSHGTNGVHVENSGTLQATGSAFMLNSGSGVLADANANVVARDGEIHSNQGTYDFNVGDYPPWWADPNTIVDASGNWWGTTDPVQIAQRIRDNYDDPANLPIVDRCSYRSSAGGPPVLDAHCPDLYICDESDMWDQTDKPYHLTTRFRVCPTGTLTVGPGVDVLTGPDQNGTGREIRVEGTLEVQGTAAAPVTFGSSNASPQPGDWSGIYIASFGEARMSGADVRDARIAVDAAGAAAFRASGSRFVGNAWYGIRTDGTGPFVLTGSSIHSNLGSYDLVVTDGAPEWLFATDCWWGTTNENEIRERIFDRRDNHSSAWVAHRAYGAAGPGLDPCNDPALGRDRDGDGRGDFEDNCPDAANAGQADGDGDRMGDDCDPDPANPPAGDCDGFEDVADGWLDGDGDGWGDPCDFQPTRRDSYPGAPELCDARDNDGDAVWAFGEQTDGDEDETIACGDCDDLDPVLHVCACEICSNVLDDDCDGLIDGPDPDCVESESCVILSDGTNEPVLTMGKGPCGGATLAGPFEVIRGDLGQVRFAGGSVDLGRVHCVDGNLDWDRVTDLSADPNPSCGVRPMPVFYLARDSDDADFGAASGGERRDAMDPDPACP